MTGLGSRSIRFRAVLASALVTLVGVSAFAVVTVVVTHRAVLNAAESTLAARAGDVAAQLVETGGTEIDPSELGPPDATDPVYVQVVTSDGRVVGQTQGLPADAQLCPAGNGGPAYSDAELSYPKLSGSFRRYVQHVEVDGATFLVCAVRSDSAIEAVRRSLVVAFALVVPVVVALVSLLVWRAVGLGLNPVSRLTRQAAQMTTLDAGRLAVPRTGDEVEQLAVTLNAMLDRLQRQSTATRQFVADAGHELRSPLATMRVGLELRLDEEHGEDPLVTGALEDVARLERLVDDLLVLTRADAAEPLRPQPVDVLDLVADEVAVVRRRCPGLTFHVGGTHEVAMADERGLQHVVVNLLDNAARHARSRVEVDVRRDGQYLQLSVVDDGPGLDPADTKRVFERFVRLDDARVRDEGGSGLGLAIVASTAGRLGGEATALPGPGGRFHLRLPLADGAAPAR